MQALGEEMMLAPGAKTRQAFKAALQRAVYSENGRLSLYFRNEYQRIVGRATQLAATLEALAEGPKRLTDVAKRIGAPSGTTARYIERLEDVVVKTEDGAYALADSVFASWIRWRAPGGTVVPMTIVGDEAEKAVARHLAMLGFELVYQSRASRGAFDLLAIRGAVQLGIQVKRSDLPLRFKRTAWKRMAADARRFDWRWVVAAVAKDGAVRILDPRRASHKNEVRLSATAVIDNLPAWIER
jgi:Holliday junction resolvase